MLVVIAQPDPRREAFAEEALSLAGFEVQVATCWEEVVALCLAGGARVLVVATNTPRASPVTVARFCALPRRDRPGLVLWSEAGAEGLARVLGDQDRMVGPGCTAADLTAAVAEAGATRSQQVVELHPEEVALANEAGVTLVAGFSERRREELSGFFRARGLRVACAGCQDELVVRLYLEAARLVVLDLGMGDSRALSLGQVARAWSPDLPLVFWTEILPEPLHREVRRLQGRVVVASLGVSGLVEAIASAGVGSGSQGSEDFDSPHRLSLR